MCGAENWTVGESGSEIVRNFVTVVLEKFGEDQVDNSFRIVEKLHIVNGERNILRTTKGNNFKRTGHIRRRNCLLNI